MDKDSQELFECVNLFAPNFQNFVLDHFVYFGSNYLNWSETKVLIVIGKLMSYNKITIKNNMIHIV